MKKYFCDVCGVDLPNWDDLTIPPKAGQAAAVCGLKELCPRCEGLTHRLDVPAVVLAELRRLVAEDERVEPVPPSENETYEPSAQVRSLTGHGAREKRAILAAIEAYRKEHGSGSIPALAELAKVKESVLRDMIQCLSVPIFEWRKVGKALGVEKEEAAS